MAPDLVTSMFCAYDKTRSLQDVVTRIGQNLSFLPVTYKSQHLNRELHICPDLAMSSIKTWGYGPGYACLLHSTVPYENSFYEKSDRLPFSWKTGLGNSCSNYISNHKMLHLVHPISHSFWCLWFTRDLLQGKALLPWSNWGVELKPLATMEAKMLHEPCKLTQQAVNVSYMMVPWGSSDMWEICSSLFPTMHSGCSHCFALLNDGSIALVLPLYCWFTCFLKLD